MYQVRRFNRAITRRTGALNESFLGRGRPLGAARMLYEIGAAGADLRDLRVRLGLDSGYLSRLLKGLEKEGLVAIGPSPEDARVRRAELTDAGLTEVAVYDSLSDAFARTVLAPLEAEQRYRLVAAMGEVERLMGISAVEIGLEPAGGESACWCLGQYFRELAERFEGGFDHARSISAETRELTPPAGAFLVARRDGLPIGCGALKVTPNGVGEIKRMWVDETARGLGIGRRMLSNLESTARDFGLQVLRLETNRSLTEAQALYSSAGYREVAAFNDEPYAHHWFERRLN